MNNLVQQKLEKLFSTYRPRKNSSVYETLGRFFKIIIPKSEVVVADIGIGYNPGPLYNLERGFESRLYNLEQGTDFEKNPKKLKKIGVDLSKILHGDIECKVGMAQKLPFDPGEVDGIIYNDLLSHMEYSLPWTTTLKLISEEIIKKSPKFAVFSDPRNYFRFNDLSKKQNDYEFISSILNPHYIETGLQDYVDRIYNSSFGSPHVWMLFMERNLYNSNLE
jgi:hypothetical protein